MDGAASSSRSKNKRNAGAAADGAAASSTPKRAKASAKQIKQEVASPAQGSAKKTRGSSAPGVNAEPAAPEGVRVGRVTAYYPREGLIGERYGYIEFREPGAQKIGVTEMISVKHYSFQEADADPSLVKLLSKEKPMHDNPVYVSFRPCGCDRYGKSKAIQVKLSSQKELPKSQKQSDRHRVQAQPEEAKNGESKALSSEPWSGTPWASSDREPLRKAIVRAWKGLGECTIKEIKKQIEATPKLLQKAEAAAGSTPDGDNKQTWPVLLADFVKHFGVKSGERESADGKNKALYKMAFHL
mmetsp:Transcript_76038/g.180976  ORF Transcript_76038/g.180976 Transcript_76038/m.180976 type:complete len:299 (-) Transcript_76038:153-1049(-)